MTDRDARIMLLDFLDAESDQVDVSVAPESPEPAAAQPSQSDD